ncbi:TetR/AcrR family transcriptional regulator [Pseudonocardia sp. ICBG1293]|uniref:TetR/AcrR family transcriptional regulator n=1 Tax=Pseudonocardia sp. ICBG1293 TaxID=2844382 RepID=UPI001CCF2212|nr:TetR/AcrR family transcriptional regulator [Pseudonocardia sp. ICBG1293]
MIGEMLTDQEARCHGLRERKKVRTRQALRAAALERARTQGPDAFTVEEVCADVDVAPRTFFNHFPSKDAVLFDWDTASLDELAAEVRDRPETSPLAAATAVLAEVAEALTTSPTWHGQMELLRAHPELHPRIAHVGRTVELTVARGLAERDGATTPSTAHRLAAAAAMAVLQVAVAGWLTDPAGRAARRVYGEVLAAARTAFAELAD